MRTKLFTFFLSVSHHHKACLNLNTSILTSVLHDCCNGMSRKILMWIFSPLPQLCSTNGLMRIDEVNNRIYFAFSHVVSALLVTIMMIITSTVEIILMVQFMSKPNQHHQAEHGNLFRRLMQKYSHVHTLNVDRK
mgnify:CR=1 FL=1